MTTTSSSKKYADKLIALSNELPDFCTPFLLETGADHTVRTRCAYAYDLCVFFDYLISYHPYFAEMDSKKSIQTNDLYQVSTSDINRFLSKLLETLSKKTVARKRASLSSFFTYMSAGTHSPLKNFNPVLGSIKVKLEKNDTVIYLTVEEQNILIEGIKYGKGLTDKQLMYHELLKKRDTALVVLLLDTGMRVSELNNLDIKDVDFDSCSAIITRKGEKIQQLYFSDEACGYLQEYLNERKSRFPFMSHGEPLFVTQTGDRLSVRAIEEMVKKYARANLPQKADLISPHKLRSSFAMAYYPASGYDLLALQKELGHNTLAATNIYSKATETTLRNNRSLLENVRKQL